MGAGAALLHAVRRQKTDRPKLAWNMGASSAEVSRAGGRTLSVSAGPRLVPKILKQRFVIVNSREG